MVVGYLGCALRSVFYTFRPCGTFIVLKDHFNDIQFYTTLTVHVVSIDFDGPLRQNAIPCGTFLAIEDHFDNI